MKKSLICLSLSFLFVFFGITAFAEGFNFVHQETFAGDTEHAKSSLEASIFFEEPDRRSIVSFDVREDGVIALAHDFGMTKRISIYSENMDFLFGYKFKHDGVIAIAWDDHYLQVYCVRGDFMFSLDEKANILNIVSIPMTDENRNYIDQILYANRKVIGDKEYLLSTEGIWSFINTSFSTLSITQNGRSTVLYDAGIQHFLQMFMVIGGALAFLVIVFVKIYKYHTKPKSLQLGKLL